MSPGPAGAASGLGETVTVRRSGEGLSATNKHGVPPYGGIDAATFELAYLSCRAGCGIPAARVGELLEIGARRIGAREVLRILDLADDRQPAVAVRQLVEIPVLGDGRLLTVGRAVLAHIARTQVRGDDLQIARRDVPLRDRMTLPRRLGGSGRVAETKQSRLRAGVCLHLQRRIVLPRDAQATGQTHDAARTVGAALLPCCFILRGIPAFSELAAFGAERNRVEDALVRRHHPVLPVLDDRRDPVAGEIDRCGLTRRWRRTTGPATAAAALRVERQRAREHTAESEEEDSIHGHPGPPEGGPYSVNDSVNHYSVHDLVGAAAPGEAIGRTRQVDHQHTVLASDAGGTSADDDLVANLQ